MSCPPSRVRVRYAETDQMGVVYHANYLVWMEVARVDYCRHAGFAYKDMEREAGVLIAVVEANCRYLHPARFDDEILIQAEVLEAGTRMIKFGYAIRREQDGKLLARGETRHIFLDSRSFSPVRLPGRYRPLFGLL